LVCTIVDGVYGTLALLQSHGQGHVNTLLRSMIEALADLEHLAQAAPERYLDRMVLTSALRKKRQGEDVIASRRDDADSRGVIGVAREACQAAKRVIDRLTTSGIPIDAELKPSERVASLGTDAIMLYAEFCFDAHNDLDALIRRHSPEGDDTLQLGGNLDDGDVLNSLGIAVFLAASALNHAASSAEAGRELLASTALRMTEASKQLARKASRLNASKLPDVGPRDA
jgi:hypothetical protein